MDDGAGLVTKQLMADLKAATRRRHELRYGTPEWKAAVKVEEDLINRIRHWSASVEGALHG